MVIGIMTADKGADFNSPELTTALREKLAADPRMIDEILRDGADRARAKGAEVLNRARVACGLRSRKS